MRPRKSKNIIIYVSLTAIFLFMGLGFARAGDIFLMFIGKKIHIRLGYKNHSGLISCFLLRFIELHEPVFKLKDFDLAIGCQSAFVEPRFDKFLGERKIILDCTLKNASLLRINEKIKENGDLTWLLDKLAALSFDDIHTELVIYGNTVEFPYVEAYAKDTKLCASGYISESRNFELTMKTFFSPETVEYIPESLRILLKEEPSGWYSYYLSVKQKGDSPSFSLESDILKINFKRVENHGS